MFEKWMRRLNSRRTQNKKESKHLRILYVNMIREIQDKNKDLHQNQFKGIKKQKPVITRKVLN